MNALVQLVYAMAATSSLVAATEQARLKHLVAISQEVKPLATKAEVRTLLGPPTAEWEHTGLFFFGSGPPQWAYGTLLDGKFIANPDFPLPIPLFPNIRLFGPNSESDLVITWDDQGRVLDVSRP
jgi:hypothetical protein